MNKQQTILAVGGGVSAVLALGAGFLAYTGWQSASDAEAKMKSGRSALSRIYQEPVTPNAANVAVVSNNLDLAQGWIGDLSRGVFRGGIPLDEGVTPGAFASRVCRETVDALVAEAPLNDKEQPVVDPGQQFAFDSYLQGAQPRKDQVPRLLRQLHLVDRLVRLVYGAGIVHLDAVARETFDQGQNQSDGASGGGVRHRGRRGGPAVSSGASRGPGSLVVPPPRFVPDESVPMSCERIGLLFTTRQEGLTAVLDAVDAMQPFAVVSGLSFAKTGEDVLVPAAPDPAKEAAPKEETGILEKPAPRTARLVSGPLFETPVQVTMFVDVYSPVVAPGGGGDREED